MIIVPVTVQLVAKNIFKMSTISYSKSIRIPAPASYESNTDHMVRCLERRTQKTDNDESCM